jgi:hypothetical protein
MTNMPNSDISDDHAFRAVMAFFAAPAAVPLCLLLFSLPISNKDATAAAAVLLVSLVLSYAGTLIFGVPIYTFLVKRGYTAFWIAIMLGFFIGALTWLIFAYFTAPSSTKGVSGVHYGLSDPQTLKTALWPCGGLGAITGMILWLIARPDRETHEGHCNGAT